MTPNDLEVLIHYHTSSGPHPRIKAPAVSESINGFLKDGILKRTGDLNIVVTEMGRAWLDIILETPYPTMVWADIRITDGNFNRKSRDEF